MPTYVTTTTTRTRTVGGGSGMGNVSFNKNYLSTNRGLIKIFQIICGFGICAILCSSWYGGRSCFNDGRLGYNSGLTFICVVINVVLFILNILNLGAWGLEKWYALVGAILFLIASVIIVWFVWEHDAGVRLIMATILTVAEFVLYLYDYKILNGEAFN